MAGALTFHEELLLLALNDSAGTPLPDTAWHQGLAAAVLAELLYLRRISLDTPKKLVNVEDPTPTGDPAADECLTRMREARRRKRLANWVSNLAGRGDLRHTVATGLARRGVLRVEEDKVLLIFTRKVYPEVDPGPERALIDRMREAILSGGDVDPRTAVIVSLADAANILRHLFDRQELKGARRRIKDITSGDAVGEAAKEAITAMQVAIATSAINPVIITTT